ncbi:uncharacterized protein [Panulirus ornatus]|uniref:uncharacterized protein isoform X2 n=1 Tax=Panulirus ornatus TaxID=150431 RepID=UPI003A87ABC5
MEELPQCLLCQECFDDGQHIPVALPACGHTFCRPCLVRLRDMRANSAFKCPTCRKEYQECTPENLPCNWVVLNLLNNNHQPKKDEQSKKTKDSDSCTKSKVWKGIGYGLAATAGAASLVAAAPVALTAAGFTSAGIASGSLAASMMSSAALANGGGIAAGGLVAALQSAGAAGIGATATGALASTGAGIGFGLSKVTDWFLSKDGGAKHASAGENGKRDDDDGKGDDKDGKRDDDDGKGDDKGGKVVGKGDDEDSSDDEDDTCWQV